MAIAFDLVRTFVYTRYSSGPSYFLDFKADFNLSLHVY